MTPLDLLKRRDQGMDDLNLSSLKLDHQDEGGAKATADWASVGLGNGLASAGFSSATSGLFGGGSESLDSPFKSDMLFGSTSGADLTGGSGGLSSLVPPGLSGSSSSPPAKKPEEIKWFYRDPSGQVQGPFEAQEMQDWYKAGFFTPTLMLRRDDESVFEPLMVLTQKVGNEDQPFLQPRPSASVAQPPVPPPSAVRSVDHLFGPPTGSTSNGATDLFQSKYMPFGNNNVPTTPGGSLMDSFLNNGTGMYSSPYNNTNAFTPGGSLLNNRWDQPQPSPSAAWLNPTSPLGPFGGHQNVFGAPSLNSPGVGGAGGLFDYGATTTTRPSDPLVDHQQQQYMNILQQNQQQRSMQFQQQFNQMQFPPTVPNTTSSLDQQQPQQAQQQQNAAFKNVVQLENFSGSNHASPVLSRPNLNAAVSQSAGGWGSVPGTPVGDVPSSPWGSIVSTAIPTKVSDELQAKAPGAQSPRAPSSPNRKAIEKPIVKPVVNTLPTPSSTPVVAPAQQPTPVAAPAPAVVQKAPAPAPVAPTTTATTTTKIQSFAEIQLEEQEKEKAAQAQAQAAASKKTAAAAAQAQAQAQATQITTTEQQQTTKATPATPTVVTKPVVSLREIQQEELRIANEKKKQNKKAQISTPSWAASNSTPLSSTTTGGWSQPTHKPLSLREIQELEAKEALKKKKEPSAAEYLAQQQALANATPSTLSWGVVVPNNSKSSSASPASPAVATGAVNNANSAAWTAPSGPKKTLREIQQEEELAMKKKNAKAVKTTAMLAAQAAAQAASSTPKAYAVSAAPVPAGGAGWTTVTSIRAPKPVAAAPTPAPAPVPQPTVIKPVSKPTPRPSGPSEDFRRWCRKALRDLNSGVNQEEIIGMLISFPVDNNASEIIEDVIYANSLRIDGKRFAQEFMKRRKADMAGRIDIVTAGLNDQEEDPNDFKVVTTKKGKKKL